MFGIMDHLNVKQQTDEGIHKVVCFPSDYCRAADVTIVFIFLPRPDWFSASKATKFPCTTFACLPLLAFIIFLTSPLHHLIAATATSPDILQLNLSYHRQNGRQPCHPNQWLPA
jgi:hypothetical protein